MVKFLRNYRIIFFVFFILWLFDLFYLYSLFSEINYFTTKGASLIIQILEFSTFRFDQLKFQLIIYFILLSVNFIYIQFCLKYVIEKRKYFYIVINCILILLSILISDIFIPISMFLVFLTYIITWSSQRIYTIFSHRHIRYDEGDIIYSSEIYPDRDTMIKNLEEKLQQITCDKDGLYEEIIEINNQFYFTILAKKKVQIDKEELL